MEMRSTLGSVKGLGSNKTGVRHWWSQRLSAIALVPLSIWFVYSVVSLNGADHIVFKAWLGQHANLVMILCFIVTLFYHTYLGLQVILEDYIHSETAKTICILVVRFTAFLSGLSCILAALRVAFIV